MALSLNKLSARAVTTIKKPGRHGDGGDLYLVVDKSGARRWVFLYRRDDRLREMGLGGLNAVTLARARELASEARANLPGRRRPDRGEADAPVAVPTFGDEADGYIEAMKPQFRNAKHIAQREMTLREYAAPLRPKPVNEITTADILEVLKPIGWRSRRQRPAPVAGSSAFWTHRKRRAIEAAKILPCGAGTWTSCYQNAGSFPAAIIGRCHIPTCQGRVPRSPGAGVARR